jgi:hypothetical protein
MVYPILFCKNNFFFFQVATPFPDVELQCRVIKKWRHLSTLIIDVIPWCLFVNKTISTVYVKDMENKVEIELLSGQAIAPYKFKVCNKIRKRKALYTLATYISMSIRTYASADCTSRLVNAFILG